MLTYGSRKFGAFTEYFSHLYEFDLFPCPKRCAPQPPFLRVEEVVFRHPVMKNGSNILQTRGTYSCHIFAGREQSIGR